MKLGLVCKNCFWYNLFFPTQETLFINSLKLWFEQENKEDIKRGKKAKKTRARVSFTNNTNNFPSKLQKENLELLVKNKDLIINITIAEKNIKLLD